MTRKINIILHERHALTELSHDELILNKQTKTHARIVDGINRDMDSTTIKRLKRNTTRQ